MTVGNGAFAEIVIIEAKDARVGAEAEFVRAVTPGEIVVDEKARGAAALDPGVVEPADGGERERSRRLPCRTMGNAASVLSKIAGAEEAAVPGEGGIEIIDEVLRKNVSIACGERIERLRRKCVEERIDGIGEGGLKSVVGLKAIPGGVLLVDVVIDANGLDLLVIVARMRDALAICAAVSVVGDSRARLRRNRMGSRERREAYRSCCGRARTFFDRKALIAAMADRPSR